jgi:hydrogenase maturation factor
MCLTIPYKVIKKNGSNYAVEDIDGRRQEIRSMVALSVGDYAMVQQGCATEKLLPEEAHEIFTILTNKEAKQ